MRHCTLPLVVLVVACSGRQGAESPDSVATPAPAAAVDSAVPVATLERTPCFGTCPVYQVSIFRNGAVRFVGTRHVTHQGVATDSISPGAVDSLAAELDAAGYFGFADDYVLDAPACGLYATDSPTVTTSLTTKGRTKRVRHDYGCSGAPPELHRLEQRIDEVAGTSRWTGR